MSGNVNKQTSITILLAVDWTKDNSTLHAVHKSSSGEGR